MPTGEHRWLTVVSPEAPDGVELLLEPDEHPAAAPFKAALVEDGVPYTSFAVADVQSEFDRLKARASCSPRTDDDGTGDHRRVRRHLRRPDPDRLDGLAARRSLGAFVAALGALLRARRQPGRLRQARGAAVAAWLGAAPPAASASRSRVDPVARRLAGLGQAAHEDGALDRALDPLLGRGQRALQAVGPREQLEPRLAVEPLDAVPAR